MVRHRLRVTFAKGLQLRYISHLHLQLAWERALRRARIPLAYSQGYNPQAKLQLASGLPLGNCGTAEVLDVILTESMSPEEFTARIGPALPQGLTISEVREMPLKSQSLQSALHQAEYLVTVETSIPANELTRRVEHLLAADHLELQRIRKGRWETFDLRPLVNKVRLESSEEDQAIFWMRLSAGQRGNARPDAVLTALDLADTYSQVERIKLLFEFDIQ